MDQSRKVVGLPVLFISDADARRCALARNAIDVLMRRKWGVILTSGGWQVVESRPGAVNGVVSYILRDEPVSAILDTEEWVMEEWVMRSGWK